MHVYAIDIHLCVLHNPKQMWQLMNGNPKFTIDMTNGNVGVATSHHVWIDTHSDRCFWMTCAKLLQYGQIVDIDLYAELCSHFNFFQRHTIWCIDDLFWPKSSGQAQFHFLYRDRIEPRTKCIEEFQNGNIGKCLYGIVDSQMLHPL